MWRYYQPVKVIFGKGEFGNLGKYMEEAGLERAYLICNGFQVRSGKAAEAVTLSEGRLLGVFSDIDPNPTIKNVASAIEAVKDLDIDGIVAMGGGSAMDCAKALAVCLAEGCTPVELIDGCAFSKALPILAVPTTAGTASEVTAGAILSDRERMLKKAIFGTCIFPKLALVDPVLTYTVPAKVTAASGLDVIAHSFDAMTSVKANEATDALALRAAQLAVKYLERAVRNGSDEEARDGMAMASNIAGLAFSQTGTTGSHACSYILTAKYNLPHGEACAFTLDAWLVENAKVKPVLNEYMRSLGFEDAAGAAAWLNEKKIEFGMRTKLDEIGAAAADIPEIVASSMASGNMANNIAQIGADGVAAIFERLV